MHFYFNGVLGPSKAFKVSIVLPGGTSETKSSLMSLFLSLAIDTLRFSSWWYLHSLTTENVRSVNQTVKEIQIPNWAVNIWLKKSLVSMFSSLSIVLLPTASEQFSKRFVISCKIANSQTESKCQFH